MTEKTLADYRAELQSIGDGMVTVRYALELVATAERLLDERHGEHTIMQAVLLSGRSRSWFERRIPEWEARGLARHEGRTVLVKAAVIPRREDVSPRSFDPGMDPDAVARLLVA